MGLAPGGLPNAKAGPGLVRGEPKKGGAGATEDADRIWPMYRRDVYRSGSSPAALGSGALERRWATVVASPPRAPFDGEWGASPFVRGIVTPPVAAGGRVVVAAPDTHRVTALDAGTGKVLWSRTAGGRVDLPPTLCGNLCLFGAHDGWVTCLDAGTGALVWKFRAAPSEARIAAYGQLESPWPVPGSILIDRGPSANAGQAVAYFAAGRHPVADGGIRVYAVQVRTGRIVWEHVLNTYEQRGWYSVKLPKSKYKIGYDFEPVDLLVKDGDRVAMSRWRFKPADGSIELDLASVQYRAFGGRAVPRGIWGYGIRQTKKVEPKPPAVFDGGRIHTGKRGDVALLLAGGTLLAADAGGEIRAGERRFRLEAPPVHDGLIAAYGRLYVSTRDGRVVCVEPAAGKQPVD
jgi:outer membrane protein assembly factor BamB